MTASQHLIERLSVALGDNADVAEIISLLNSVGAPAGAQYLTLAVDAGLPNERVFTLGAGLSAVDGGPGGAYTLSVTGGAQTTQYVALPAQTWNGTSHFAAVTTAAWGADGSFLLPDITTVLDSATFTAKNVDGTWAINVTPFAGQFIDGGGAEVVGGAGLKSAITLTANVAALSWMIS